MNLSLQYDGIDDEFHRELLKFFSDRGFKCVHAGRISPRGPLIVLFHKEDPFDKLEILH